MLRIDKESGTAAIPSAEPSTAGRPAAATVSRELPAGSLVISETVELAGHAAAEGVNAEAGIDEQQLSSSALKYLIETLLVLEVLEYIPGEELRLRTVDGALPVELDCVMTSEVPSRLTVRAVVATANRSQRRRQEQSLRPRFKRALEQWQQRNSAGEQQREP